MIWILMIDPVINDVRVGLSGEGTKIKEPCLSFVCLSSVISDRLLHVLTVVSGKEPPSALLQRLASEGNPRRPKGPSNRTRTAEPDP
jgi:hypothetical protein